MNKKLFIFLLILITIINLSATATILYERYSRKEPPQDSLPEPPQNFGPDQRLTPEQLEQMKASREEFFRKFDAPFKEFMDLRTRLFEELGKDELDSTLLDSMLDEMGRRQTELRKITIQHIIESRKNLSPEQRAFMMKIFMKKLNNELGYDFGPRHDRGKRYKNRNFDGSGHNRFQDHQPDSELKLKHGGAL